MIRFVRPALGLAALLASALPAQNTVRWNDVMASLDEQSDDPPSVRVWLDQRIYRAGDAVRVGYRVEEDAFVVVARVDFDGNLTVLFPAGKNRVTTVSAGADNFIRSARFGTRATFLAAERIGSTGYVFAIASRAPIDVSRLSQRDFSSWVTGVPVGRPMTRYIGDPYRVIQRFARLVLYNPNAEWDYDMEFYSVDQPFYAQTATMYSGYCNGFLSSRSGYGQFYGSDYEDYAYGANFTSPYGYSLARGCNGYEAYLSCYNAFWGYGFYMPVFCGRGRFGQVAWGPTAAPPVGPEPGRDSVNTWVPDSIGRPNVEKAAPGTVNGPHVMAVDPSRPAPVNGWRAEDDLSFSIPARALRGSRTRDGATDITRAPGSTGTSGPVPMPVRPTPEVANTPIEWVRPPRSLEPSTRGEIDRMPTRGGIRKDAGFARDNDRGNGAPAWEPPPPRTSSPIFDREPNRANSDFRSPPQRDFNPSYGGGGSGYNPPHGLDSRPPSPSGIESRGATIAPSSPPPAPPQPVREASSSSSGSKSPDPPEKKP